MLKHVFCFLLIFNLVIPDLALAEWGEATRMFKMSGREKRKQAKKYGCFDFSKPGKIAKAGGAPRGRVKNRNPKDEKKEYSDCTEEVTKEKIDILEDIEKVNKDIK